MEQKQAILLLEDGSVFKGTAAGAIGTTTGEICFNTGMTGYQEVFTDPSYFGQILIMTNVHIGNYGATPAEMESTSAQISGMICRNFANHYSRDLASQSLNEFLEEQGVVSIYGLDTRAIVKHIRSKGAMNAIISSETLDIGILSEKLKKVPSMAGLELSSKVTTSEPYYFGNENSSYKLAVVDLGIKKNILRCFAERDCYMKVFPAKTTFETMQEWNPDGYFLSNGPGDPSSMSYAVDTTKEILQAEIPLFGICLGQQILALANGISTYKMHHGHRGLNHPVKNMIDGRSEITSQNHGFEVNRDDIEKSDAVEVTHVNLNDGTIEGLRVVNKPAFSVQYHPESSPGPHDSRYLFDKFIDMMESSKKKTSSKSLITH
ncbi:MAG: glutamine-hydrolyzing carbamoyl-phosphate synthase small subunit [Chitinophagales bacterium]|nr:glutamine-hydrolyzing carbamoyl-phosphate synthase small subunit [Chitinophagales bacterium]